MIKFAALAVSALLIGLDQWIKIWAASALPNRAPVIPGLFYMTYLENTGAAFGIFQGQAFALGLVSMVILAAILVVILSGKIRDRLLIWGLTLIFAGGVGNLIDRMARGFVIDYLDFSALFGFPVFNFADCLVVGGTGLVAYYMLFIDGKKPAAGEGALKDEDTPSEDGQANENI